MGLSEIRKSGRHKEQQEKKNEIIAEALSRIDGLENRIKILESNVAKISISNDTAEGETYEPTS